MHVDSLCVAFVCSRRTIACWVWVSNVAMNRHKSHTMLRLLSWIFYYDVRHLQLGRPPRSCGVTWCQTLYKLEWIRRQKQKYNVPCYLHSHAYISPNLDSKHRVTDTLNKLSYWENTDPKTRRNLDGMWDSHEGTQRIGTRWPSSQKREHTWRKANDIIVQPITNFRTYTMQSVSFMDMNAVRGKGSW